MSQPVPRGTTVGTVAGAAMNRSVITLCCLMFASVAPKAQAACEKLDIFVCWTGDQFTEMLQDASESVQERGREKFGSGFELRNYLRYSNEARDLTGNMDVIIPARKLDLEEDKPTEALFFQGGIYRHYNRDTMRDLWCYGGVLRVISDPEKHNGIFGVWGLVQQDALAGHKRLGVGVEYEGEFGSASAQYYIPVTGWHRVGKYMEKGQTGGSWDMRFRFSGKLSIDSRLSYWENRSRADEYDLSGDVGVSYYPRSWLELKGQYRLNGGSQKDYYMVGGFIHVPLGVPRDWRRYQRDYSYKLYNAPRVADRLEVIEKSL